MCRTSDAPRKRDQYWLSLTDAIAKRPDPEIQFYMLVDGNAALGSKRSAHVGGAFATPECANGCAFHKFLADFDMALPSTFEHLHEGPSATFTLPNGAPYRTDVVAVPRSLLE